MSPLTDDFQFPASSTLLTRWQAGDNAALERLRVLFDAVIEGQFDTLFKEPAPEPAPADSVCVTTSLHLTTLTILNQLYGLTSADFYKGDPQRYVRTTLMTQRLLGIDKLTLSWPAYAFSVEALGQTMTYLDEHAPGPDLNKPLVSQTNWREVDTPNLESGIPEIIDNYLACFADLTGLDPVAHLSAPYSLAADILGQEDLIMALLDAPDFVDEFLDHLTNRVLVPWLEHLSRRFPKVWIELSDASGSPQFIGPRPCRKIAARPVRRLINDFPWGNRVFVANYRGDRPLQAAGRRAKKGEPETERTKSSAELPLETIDFKLSVCPEFIIKLEADEAPLPFYVEQAIQRRKALYLGIGATRIDRSSLVDRQVAQQELKNTAAQYAQAIKSVSETLAHNGQPRSTLAWPGDVYIEDINAESDFGFVKTIVETVTRLGRMSSP